MAYLVNSDTLTPRTLYVDLHLLKLIQMLLLTGTIMQEQEINFTIVQAIVIMVLLMALLGLEILLVALINYRLIIMLMQIMMMEAAQVIQIIDMFLSNIVQYSPQ